MRLGVVFPQTEIGADPGAVRAYIEAAEDLGYEYVLVYDHVLGADPANRPGWSGPYTHKQMFHEPFVLFGYIAAISRRLELVTGVLIFPQRQTALVAKQAAEIDVLSGGRLRLGIGVGWNEVEFEALGENFHNRGKRVEEQVAVLRALWTNEVVSFQGRWHHIPEAGINPLPIQRPIPLWMGGRADVVLRRIARIGDGWFPQFRPDEAGREIIEKLRTYTREAGRDPSAVGIDARLSISNTPEESWVETVEAWRSLGATHLAVHTMGAGLESPEGHIGAIRRVKEVLGR